MTLSRETRRQQFKNIYPGQILRPDQLEPGQDIAALRVFPGASPVVRGFMALARRTIADVLRREDAAGQQAAAREGWNFERDTTFNTLWRGKVMAIGGIGVGILPTHGKIGDSGFDSLCPPAELLPVADQHDLQKLFAMYEDIGLAPIPAGQPGAGRWHPTITVTIPKVVET